jgi:hypothetical protein
MVKGEDFGNDCMGDGYCFARRRCFIECDEKGECICGLKSAINKYIRHEYCHHNCILLKCQCGLYIPEYELNQNDGICNDCVDNNN